jgi:hypothetical protein
MRHQNPYTNHLGFRIVGQRLPKELERGQRDPTREPAEELEWSPIDRLENLDPVW